MPNKNTAPPGKRYTPEQIISLARKVGIPENLIPTFVAISVAENRKGEVLAQGDLKRVDDKWGPSVGLMQIRSLKNPLKWDKEVDRLRDEKKLQDPEYNLRTAYEIYKDENGFTSWSTYNLNKNKIREYEEFLPEMEALALRTKPTMIPSRTRMETNILNGGRGMSKPVTRNIPTDLDDIAKIPIAGKEYTLGAAQDLFRKGDEKTKNAIVTLLKEYNPGRNYKTADSVNVAWNKLVEDYSISNSVTKKPFTTWFIESSQYNTELAGIGDGTSVFLQPSVTPKDQAYQDFNEFIFDATGMNANPKDAEQYYKELRKLEQSKVAKQVTTRTGATTTQVSTPGITKEDRELLAAKFVDKYIDTKGIQNIGGIVGSNLSTLRKLASDYNITLSDADIRKEAINSLTDKNALENFKVKMQKIAKVRYSNFAQSIDEGLTIKDIASPYINKMANTLEVNPNTINLDNRYVDKALTSNMNFTDFDKLLRNTPEFPYTNNARSEAASYINWIQQDFRNA